MSLVIFQNLRFSAPIHEFGDFVVEFKKYCRIHGSSKIHFQTLIKTITAPNLRRSAMIAFIVSIFEKLDLSFFVTVFPSETCKAVTVSIRKTGTRNAP